MAPGPALYLQVWITGGLLVHLLVDPATAGKAAPCHSYREPFLHIKSHFCTRKRAVFHPVSPPHPPATDTALSGLFNDKTQLLIIASARESSGSNNFNWIQKASRQLLSIRGSSESAP